MKKLYLLSWDERHSAKVEAENEKEAKELVLSGEIESENAEYNGSIEAIEL